MARQISRRALLRASATATVGAAALGLVSCGDEGDSEGKDEAVRDHDPSIAAGTELETTPAPARVLAPPRPSEGEPEQGGTLRMHAALDLLDFFDIHRSRFPTTQLFSALQQSKLLRYADINAGRLEPDLAAVPELPDETTYVIELQPEAHWWDRSPTHGRACTADDVRANFARQIAAVDASGEPDPLFQRQAQYRAIAQMDVVDERTLVLSTTEPDGTFLGTGFAGPWAFIQAPEVWEQGGDALRNRPLRASTYSGTGAFQIDTFAAERVIAFKRNPHYFRVGLPWLDTIELRHMIDPAAQANAYLDGDLDLWTPADPLQIEPLLPDLPTHRIGERFLPFTIQLAFSFSQGSALNPFRDQRVAQAVHLALDRPAILALAYGDFGRICGPVPPFALGWAMEEETLAGTPGYRPEKSEDIAEARALLSAAAFTGSVPIAVPDVFEATHPGVSALIAETLAANLELPVEVSTLGYNAILTGMREGDPPASLGWGEPPTDADPTADLLRSIHTAGPDNRGGLQDPAIDVGIERMRTTLEREERRRIFHETVQPLLLERPSWLVNIGIGVQRTVSRSSIHLPRFGYGWDGHHFERVWIEGAATPE
ncbi:MAG: ABC transporter substrate-binding protein [Chloroflexi bacterium]|nr:ABC transporter substrate-binding protein [Chloroflexota bacterium]